MRLIDADEIRIKPEYMHDICGVVMIRVEDIARILNDMPTIEPEPHWIPCSERLPDKEGMYLITEQNYGFKEDAFFKNEFVHTSYFSVNKKEFQDTVYIPNCSNITAWMPLPEGYRGEQGE